MTAILTDSKPITSTSKQVYPIRVEREDYHDWQRALTRGQEQRLAVERRNSATVVRIVMTGYAVESHSKPGTFYGVSVSRDWEGDVYTICECDAGLHCNPCTHAALALQDAKLWPFPVFAQAEMGLSE